MENKFKMRSVVPIHEDVDGAIRQFSWESLRKQFAIKLYEEIGKSKDYVVVKIEETENTDLDFQYGRSRILEITVTMSEVKYQHITMAKTDFESGRPVDELLKKYKDTTEKQDVEIALLNEHIKQCDKELKKYHKMNFWQKLQLLLS